MLASDYVENGVFGSDRDDGTDSEFYQFQPNQLPAGCSATVLYNSETGNGGTTTVGYQSTLSPKSQGISIVALENVQYLYDNGIINWPNFTVTSASSWIFDGRDDKSSELKECLPHCGLCTSHAGDSTYITFNLLVIGVLLPFIGLCGVMGNSISAFIYSRPGMRKCSTNVYLCALGCSDNAVVLTALFLFFIDSVKRHSATLSVLYSRLSPFIYPAGMMAQTCSVYFTITAGIDCFVQVCLTKELQSCCTTPKCVHRSIAAVLLFSFFYNSPHFFEAILVDCWHTQFQSRSVEVCPAPFRFNPTYVTVYYKYMYSIFLAVGPLIVLIILNSCIILVTVYVSKKRSVISRIKHNQYHHQQQQRTNNNNSIVTIPTNRHGPMPTNGDSAKQDGRNLSLSLNTSAAATTTALLSTPNNNSAPAVETTFFRKASATGSMTQQRTNNIAPSHSATPSSSNGDDNVALILVVLLFIGCNTIALLINIFETKLSALLEWRINYIIDISNLLVVFNSSFNIIIYYNFSQSFRLTFRKRFGLPSQSKQEKQPFDKSQAHKLQQQKLLNSNNVFVVGSPATLTNVTKTSADITKPVQQQHNPSTDNDRFMRTTNLKPDEQCCAKCSRRIFESSAIGTACHNSLFPSQPLKTTAILRLATMDEMESDDEEDYGDDKNCAVSPPLLVNRKKSSQLLAKQVRRQSSTEIAPIFCKACSISDHYAQTEVEGDFITTFNNSNRCSNQHSYRSPSSKERLMSSSLLNENTSSYDSGEEKSKVSNNHLPNAVGFNNDKSSSTFLARRWNGQFSALNNDNVSADTSSQDNSHNLCLDNGPDRKSQQSVILLRDYEEDTQLYIDAVVCTINDESGSTG